MMILKIAFMRKISWNDQESNPGPERVKREATSVLCGPLDGDFKKRLLTNLVIGLLHIMENLPNQHI